MLKHRIMTASVLVAILVGILWSGQEMLFALFLTAFFGAASWENARLFDFKYPVVFGIVSAALFFALYTYTPHQYYVYIAGLAVAIWVVVIIRYLWNDLPRMGSFGSHSVGILYWVTELASFLSTLYVYERSKLLLLSVLMIVWLADTGAYAAGRLFGRRKLAPTISPGKTWEGVFGGAFCVLAAGVASIIWLTPHVPENIASVTFTRFGWAAALAVLVLLVAASVVGDLIESKIKRRAGFKDSSNLLPGHGGVLDRFDSVIPVMSLALVFGMWV